MIDELNRFREYLSTQNPYHIIAVTTAAAGLVGILLGRSGAKKREAAAQRNHDITMANIDFEKTRELRLTSEVGNAVELRKLEYAENKEQHARSMEERRYSDEQKLQEQTRRAEQINAVAQMIGPVLTDYLRRLEVNTDGANPDIEKARTEYRGELIQAYCNDYDIYDPNNDIDPDLERIESVVTARFPYPDKTEQPELPRAVKQLVSLLQKTGFEDDEEYD